MRMWSMPRQLRLLLVAFAVLWLLQSLLRLVFLGYFKPPVVDWSQIGAAMWLGARFDARYAALLTLPWACLILLRKTDPCRRPPPPRGLIVLWTAIGVLVVISLLYVHINDAGYYAYLATRLQANILNYLQDWKVSMAMVRETYPYRTILLGLLLAAIAVAWATPRWLRSVARQPVPNYGQHRRWKVAAWTMLAVFLYILAIHGRLAQYPLRWSEAFTMTDAFASQLAQNPLQSFIDTLDYRRSPTNLAAATKAARDLAQWLGSDPGNERAPSFARRVEVPPRAKPLNVVLVIMESFSAYRSSVFGNALDPTPNMKKLAQQGVLFDRMFTAHAGTAHGVFATMTGIPDVELGNTSSRNPNAVHQHLIINAFRGYQKLYFYGGNTNWANVRGLLQGNIRDLQLIEQEQLHSKILDAWGVSDVNMMQEANQILADYHRRQQPFFAVIQTSTNHRPYSIDPADVAPDRFTVRQVTDTQLKDNGFTSIEEYNAMRYMDYAVGRFMEAAHQAGYDRDTVFVFHGDHGITGIAGPNMPAAWASQKLRLTTGHTPLIFYAPGHLSPQVSHELAMQVDVMTTIASLAGISHVNTTLGRDLFNPKAAPPRLAFTINHEATSKDIGVITDRFYYRMWLDGSHAELYDLASATPDADSSAAHPEDAVRLRQFTENLYQAAHYLTTHNLPLEQGAASR